MSNSVEYGKIKAIALFSGGLDSQLAIKLVQEQGIEITALHFTTPFRDPSEEIHGVQRVAEKLGVALVTLQKTDDFFDIIKYPRFGYGKHLNPCMDCRLWILQKAWAYAQQVGAQFLITGEVVGQRPKSQHKDQILVVDRASGIPGLILRPLSAKLLDATIPEQKGWVDREKFLDIHGRSRARQLELGRHYGLVENYYATGGCPLCEHAYAVKMEDYLKHAPAIKREEIWLLRFGRHFRFQSTKIIVGRHQKDNAKLLELAAPDDPRLEVEGVGSPITIIQGPLSEDVLHFAASVTARYADMKGDEVEVTCHLGHTIRKLRVRPAGHSTLTEFRLG